MIHVIGRSYRYPREKKEFQLTKVDGYMYYFDGGHSVTDSVFMDMIDCSTEIQVFKNIQIFLF